MGWLTDLLREIPLSAVLKEKITAAESKYAATETENAILKDDLRAAKANTEQLEKQIENLTHIDLEPHEVAILKLIADAEHSSPLAEELAQAMGIHLQRTEWYLERLVTAGYLNRLWGTVFDNGPTTYETSQKGRSYLIENSLI